MEINENELNRRSLLSKSHNLLYYLCSWHKCDKVILKVSVQMFLSNILYLFVCV